MDNEILNYKDLAALPKIKAIYEVQRPDLISYEPYHRYTSDETLERYSYGEVLSLDTPSAGLHRQSGPYMGQRGKLYGGLLTPVGILQGGRSRGKTSPGGSLSLGRELEGNPCCCCRVRRKPVTLADHTRRAGTGSAAWEEMSPSGGTWQGVCPWQQERRRARHPRASLRGGGTDSWQGSQAAQPKARPLAGNHPTCKVPAPP